MKYIVALFSGLLIASCGQGDNETGSGGVTLSEARALDDAAQMLEERGLPAEALQHPLSKDEPGQDKTE